MDASSTPTPGSGPGGSAGFTGLRYGELVERRAERQPHRTAIIHGDERISYGQLLDRIRAAASFLTEQGVRPGDRVVCYSENSPEILIAVYASSRVGAVFTPVGIASPPADVGYILQDLSARVLLVSPHTVDAGREVPGVDGIPILSLQEDREQALPHLPAYVPGPAPEHRPTADSAALVVYTSGTSGHPKGVALSHGALFFNGVNTLLGLDIIADDVTLVNTPLSHVAALNTLAVATLYKGGTVVLDSKFDARRCLRQIEQFAVTTMFAVPSMLTLMAQVPGFTDANTSSLRWILGGGAPMPPELVALWASRGVPVLASYGLTEAGPSVSFRRSSDAARKSASSGTPALLTDLRIVSDDGSDLPPGQVGEVLVRGPHIASGYWGNETATAETFRQGWLASGDRGFVDVDGDLCITGRSKEIIITGGENVDPAEIEHLVVQYPGIRDAAVVGRPDPVWGEIITAVVVCDDTVELEELQQFLRPQLAKFKIPRVLERRESLPRSPVGKLLRRELTPTSQDTPVQR